MKFDFDLGERFPRLDNPPIVEAIIHWRARAQSSLEPDALRKVLLERLPEFVDCQPSQHVFFEAEFQAGPDGGKDEPRLKHRQKSDWHGFRLTTKDGRHVAQFNRDGVIFSCTQRYDHWENFTTAAKHVWSLFLELAKPAETERLGVRFINQLKDVTYETIGAYLKEPPTRPLNLPLAEFVYQSTLSVPGHPFEIRVIKLMQPRLADMAPSAMTSGAMIQGAGLFVDLDVYSTHALPNDEKALDQTLTQIRYLKNKVFFTLLKPESIQGFMERPS